MKFTIRQARHMANLTQREMAEKLNICRRTYILIEKDVGRATVQQLHDISRITKIPMADFVLSPTLQTERAKEVAESARG